MGDDRDIGLYHWSSERFSSAWVDTISVLLAKGRARVSVVDAALQATIVGPCQWRLATPEGTALTKYNKHVYR